jgi:autotransporter family porin
MKKSLIILSILFVSAFLFCGTVSATTINVKNTTNAIHNAITNSHSGDTLNLSAGTYKEHYIVVNKNLIITGPKTTGTPKAVIDAQKLGNTFIITKTAKVTLKNLLITNGKVTGDGGGIFNFGNLALINCTITKNNASSFGGGIYNSAGATMTITGATINNNTAAAGGGIGNYGNLNINNSMIIKNIAIDTGTGGAGIYNAHSCALTISKSTINNNTAIWGGGIDNLGSLTMSKCILNYNTANQKGGAIVNEGPLTVIGCNFSFNTAINNGNAILSYTPSGDTSSRIVNFNRFYKNSGTGYDIYCDTGTVNARYNWWGSNTNPSSKVSANVNISPWLVLKLKASPTLIKNGGISYVTADLLHDSNGLYHNPTSGHVQDGIIVTFPTTLGIITGHISMVNGAARATLKSGTISGLADIFAILDNQFIKTSVKIDTVPPKISSTTPTNLKTGVSRTSNIVLKFSEIIKNSTYYNNITIKNLTTGKYITLTKTISGSYLSLKTTTRSANTWYQVTIPAAAIKDYAGNNLLANYTFKFKTGT